MGEKMKIFDEIKEFFSKLLWIIRQDWQKEEWFIFGAGCVVSLMLGIGIGKFLFG